MESRNLVTKSATQKVHIIYYLSRGAQVDQPHLIEVNLPLAQEGLRLKDFKKWLSILRGQSMPNSFAWAYKRIYRTGYVWHDLADSDLIQPLCKNEYILIGSQIRDSLREKCKCGLVKGSYSFKQEEGFQKEKTNTFFDGDFSKDYPQVLVTSNHYDHYEIKGIPTPGRYARRPSSSTETDITDEIRTNECSVYKARTPILIADQGTDAATQTGESKRCLVKEACTRVQTCRASLIQPPCRLVLTDQAANVLSPPSGASTPNLRVTLESPDSETSSHPLKFPPNTKAKSKHSPSSQVLKQLLSCGSVDTDESSISNLKSSALKTHQPTRYYNAWTYRNSGLSHDQDSESIPGYSEAYKNAIGCNPTDSFVLRKALMSNSPCSPKRVENLKAKKEKKGETCAHPRRSLQFDCSKGSKTTIHSPRASVSDNFGANWRETFWSPKRDMKHGSQEETRHP